eukprot:CAMPEP_0178499064 /NCGR_PEP_ID=MMETSP0696-20121128/15619_1 /TAXON_ID=265572 /ORGANISM="Extubocellulus spinifer, Strain CCMP396" /LENGTH=326 /DNA_ID=CAMNT_0020127725 /DNA_START=96 /DNA_END=1076 /DNA_ORIENTATION=+
MNLRSNIVALLVGTGAGMAAAYAPTTVQEAWDNHIGAVATNNLTQVMMDYTEESVLLVHDIGGERGNLQEYRGLEPIEAFFAAVLPTLDVANFSMPMLDIDEEGRQVFLGWSIPNNGLYQVSDVLEFNPDFTIKYQNTVMNTIPPEGMRERNRNLEYVRERNRNLEYAPTSSLEVWKNHLDGVSERDVDKIMLDYDNTSVIRVFDFANPTNPPSTFTGPDEIRGLMEGFLPNLDGGCFELPVEQQEPDMTLIVWEVPCNGFPWVTDTLIYRDNKIRLHDISYYSVQVEEDGGGEESEEGMDTSGGATRPMALVLPLLLAGCLGLKL